MKKVLCIIAMVAPVCAVPTNAFGSVFASQATFEVESALPPAGPPLLIIDALRSNAGGIFTNQTSGFSGASGALRTVAAIPLQVAQDGFTYIGIQGPTSTAGALTNAVAFVALEGTFSGPNSVTFTSGRAFIYETTGSFLNRDPSSWGYSAGALLAEFVLAAPDDVLTSAVNGQLLASVPASSVNDSTGDALSVGNTDFQLLFAEDSAVTTATLGDNWMRDVVNVISPDPIAFEGLFVEGEQDLVPVTGGFTIAGTVFDTSDLAVLDAIAAAAGFTDLSGAAGTQGFASGLGVGGGGPTDAFYMDLSTGPGATKEGDLFASSPEFNAYPVVSNIPEASTIAIWSVFTCISALYAGRLSRKA